MDKGYGWKKYTCNGHIFWFKGYIIDSTFREIMHSVTIFLLDIKKYSENLSNFLSNLRGHYSFVICKGDRLIAVVDKVCTIPLFYTETDKYIAIGNNATSIRDSVSLDKRSLNRMSILEISMSGYTIGDKTLYKHMRQITAGECIGVHSGRIHKQYYHTYSPWRINVRPERSLGLELTSVLSNVMDKLSLSLKGKKVIVPLSAGYDSRIVASGLKQAGVKDVLCVSYGRLESFEVSIAKNIAKKLGYEFEHIVYKGNDVKNYYDSCEYSKFNNNFERYCSVEFLQDNLAISLLHANSKVDKDSVIINGMTGDFISGSHIPSIFSQFSNNSNMSKKCNTVFNTAMEEYMQKHFNLWGLLSNHDNKNKIINNISVFLEDRAPGFKDFDNMHAIFEVLEFYGRQSKYVVKGQEVYDYYGYDWRLPLWDSEFIDFWESVPLEHKFSQKLYKDVLIKNNWGGVWSDIPLNEKTINPIWIRPVRLLLKILFSPLGKKYWHLFERNTLQYWMDDSYSSRRYPYSRFIADRKRHRNVVSFATEDYIQKHTGLHLDHLI